MRNAVLAAACLTCAAPMAEAQEEKNPLIANGRRVVGDVTTTENGGRSFVVVTRDRVYRKRPLLGWAVTGHDSQSYGDATVHEYTLQPMLIPRGRVVPGKTYQFAVHRAEIWLVPTKYDTHKGEPTWDVENRVRGTAEDLARHSRASGGSGWVKIDTGFSRDGWNVADKIFLLDPAWMNGEDRDDVPIRE